MTSYELYTLFLCIIVFTVFTALFSVLIGLLLKFAIKLIRHGANDEIVQKEAEKLKKKSSRKDKIGRALSSVACVIVAVVFVFSVVLSCTENDYKNDVPSLKVVKSGSMETKNPKNLYLFMDGVDNQISTFDLILTHPLPDEMDLRLYDIVVYELDGDMILHRIVGIEEPNAKHPDQRYFLLQGDAVSTKDPFPVLYEQMRAIYKDQRIPFVGSFIAFLQSPAGWLCFILIVFALIMTPIAERKLKNETLARYELLQKRAANEATFGALRAKSPKTFRSKLRTSDKLLKSRYKELSDHIKTLDRVRMIESNSGETYKCGKTPVARLMIRGKTLNVYIALPPEEFEQTKYVFTDVSQSRSHANYPMRVRISSDRQVKWAKELIDEVAKRQDLKGA